jgi:polyhydroxyalkanoate synthesis regulator phasin
MNTKDTTSTSVQLTRAEQETQTEAMRLTQQIEAALAAVAVRTRDDPEELEARADRLERAARDLSVALRELAHERRRKREEKD